MSATVTVPAFPRIPFEALIMAQDRAHYTPDRIGALFEEVWAVARAAAAEGRDFSSVFCAHAYARTLG